MKLFEEINRHLEAHGLQLREGTIMDATLIAAPTSTKNKAKERDPEMHQTKKGNEWYFGMKAHIGVDAETGMVHRVMTTAANVNGPHRSAPVTPRTGAVRVGRCRVSGGGEASRERRDED